MKVLQVINSLTAGGAESFVVDLSIALARQGHEVHVFTYAGVLDKKGELLRRRLENGGVKFIAENRRTPLSKLSIPWRFSRVAKAFCPDVIHSHLEPSDFFTMLAMSFWLGKKKPLCVRTIHTVHARNIFPPWVHRLLMEHFDLTIACGDLVMDSYPFLPKHKTLRINNGISINNTAPDPNFRANFRKHLCIQDSEKMLLNIGSFSVRNSSLPKAQDVIVEALVMLKRSDFRFVFVGDGAMRSEIENQAIACGVRSKILFIGLVDNPEAYLSAADIVVMPSRFEGLSIACMEAVCSGKPIVVSNIDAFKLFEGKGSKFVPAGNSSALAKTISVALDDMNALTLFAQEDVPRFQNEFGIASVADKYLNAYESAILLKNGCMDSKVRDS